jgi:peptide/nickel transport system substrate-binding protein
MGLENRNGGLVQTDPKRYNPEAPWAKLEVRQALNYAIDKEAIARNILKGAARANFDPHSFEDHQTAAYPYDVNKAKQLLASAGYPKGFPITLYTCVRNPGAQLQDIGMAAATYWEAVGINVKIVPTDYPTIRASWTGGKAMNMFWTHTYSPPVSLDDAMGFSASNIIASVFAFFTTPELDQMVNAAMAEPDPTKRAALVVKANNYLTEQADFIYLLSAEEPSPPARSLGVGRRLSTILVTRSGNQGEVKR